jgi:hypothetical protein
MEAAKCGCQRIVGRAHRQQRQQTCHTTELIERDAERYDDAAAAVDGFAAPPLPAVAVAFASSAFRSACSFSASK